MKASLLRKVRLSRFYVQFTYNISYLRGLPSCFFSFYSFFCRFYFAVCLGTHSSNRLVSEVHHRPYEYGPKRPPLSPLAATLMHLPASVANKRLMAWLSPLDATLTKNIGGGPVMVNQTPRRWNIPTLSERVSVLNDHRE